MVNWKRTPEANKRLDYAFGSQLLNDSIIRIGYTPYNFVITSDHRGLFIDLNADSFLVATLAVNVARTSRHQSTDPKKCRKYVTEVPTTYLTTACSNEPPN
jgi:hypothetical protein